MSRFHSIPTVTHLLSNTIIIFTFVVCKSIQFIGGHGVLHLTSKTVDNIGWVVGVDLRLILLQLIMTLIDHRVVGYGSLCVYIYRHPIIPLY